MRNVVVTGCPRADLAEVGALAAFGVATVQLPGGGPVTGCARRESSR
jgi:hypothetical protein